MSACGVICGAVVSRTVTVKLPLATLWAASLALQVTVVVPNGNVAPEAVEHTTGTAPLTVSPAGPVASTVLLAGIGERVGVVVSTTVTTSPVVLVLPARSDAWHVTVVAPIGKVAS